MYEVAMVRVVHRKHLYGVVYDKIKSHEFDADPT